MSSGDIDFTLFTSIYSDNPDVNYGGAPRQNEALGTGKTPTTRRILVKVDFSAGVDSGGFNVVIPAGSVINADTYVELNIQTIIYGPEDHHLYRCTKAWVQGTQDGPNGVPDGATWNTYDGVNAWATPGGDVDDPPPDDVTSPGPSATGNFQFLAQACVQDALDSRSSVLNVILEILSSASDYFWDCIQGTHGLHIDWTPPVTHDIKKVSGVAWASVKVVGGEPVAHVKKLAGEPA